MLRQLLIRIPESQWSTIEKFLITSSEDLNLIVECVNQASPLPDLEDLAEKCAEETSIEPSVIEAMLSIGVNVSRLQRSSDKPAAEILEMIGDNLAISGFPEWRGKYSQAWEERRDILEKLLVTNGVIEIMSKVRELLYDFQCVLLDSAVLTDVRYVYSDRADEIKGALVSHTLGLKYLDGMEPREFHIKISDPDLKNLMSQLQRAQKKAEVTIDQIKKMGVIELTPKRNS
jgi:hypothetical protein